MNNREYEKQLEEQYIKECEEGMSMNEHQKALNEIVSCCGHYVNKGWFEEDLALLQELVDKATPKKPTVLSYSEDFRLEKIISCNSCKKPVVNVWSYRTYKPNYCHYCGRAIDWSSDD